MFMLLTFSVSIVQFLTLCPSHWITLSIIVSFFKNPFIFYAYLANVFSFCFDCSVSNFESLSLDNFVNHCLCFSFVTFLKPVIVFLFSCHCFMIPFKPFHNFQFSLLNTRWICNILLLFWNYNLLKPIVNIYTCEI